MAVGQFSLNSGDGLPMFQSLMHGSKVPLTSLHAPRLLQRKCACRSTSGMSGQCEECGRAHLGAVQRSTTVPAMASLAPSLVREVLQSSGQSLDEDTRAAMESRFGRDFSRVRVHADERAAKSAQAVAAMAYTVGRDIVFGPQQYAPATTHGQRLLAHELTHVIQQDATSGTSPAAGIRISDGDHLEREADAAADGIAAGRPVRVSASGVAQSVQRWGPFGASQPRDECAGYEQDPVSLSIVTAKHFLDDAQPGVGSRSHRSAHCAQNPYNPDRFECEVTFDDGEVITVPIESKLHNVEGKRMTPDGSEWCVYHFTCEGGILQFATKGCSANLPAPAPSGPPPAASSPSLVASRSATPDGGVSGRT
jgi:Domain of unknown function (DUF4157)